MVEDSPQISELVNDELTDMGCEVRQFTNAEEFAEAAARLNRAPDVIITDYQLIGACGTEVLRTGRTHCPEVPTILLSGIDNSDLKSEIANSDGFNAYLSKPVDLMELRTTVAKLCGLTQV